jgi:hypothetical protein
MIHLTNAEADSPRPLSPKIESAEIERRDRITLREFTDEYLLPGIPVIITGVADQWRAYALWSHDFFRAHYAASTVNVWQWFHQSGPEVPTEKEGRLGDYLDSLKERAWLDPRRPPYAEWNNFDHPELLAATRNLDFAPNWFEVLPRHVANALYAWKNLLISPAGAVYNLHIDRLGVNACVVQLCGRKRFVLYPPDQGGNLYDGRVDPDSPDYERFPAFRNATGRMEGLLSPGEIAFTPHGWWHQVTTLVDSVSVVVHGIGITNAAHFASELITSKLRGFVQKPPANAT